MATSFLKQLTGEFNETSGFYVRVGDAVEIIASVTSNQALTYTMTVGERGPLYAVSSGKIVLSRMPTGELNTYLRSVHFEPVTPKTINSKRALRDDLAIVRQAGFGYSREEFTTGIVGIATAVEHGGRLFGAFNLAVPTARYSQERDAVFRRHLAAAAASLGQMIAEQ